MTTIAPSPQCKHCTVPIPAGQDVCAFCADYTPPQTAAQRLDVAVNKVDLLRHDLNEELRGLPDDSPLFAVSDLVAVLGHLRQAAVLLDRATGAIEADAEDRAIAGTATQARLDHQLGGIQRGIRTLLAQVPAHTWTVDEAQAVWEALAGILHRRTVSGNIRRHR